MSKFTVKKSLVEVTIDYIDLDSGDIMIINNQSSVDRYKEKLKTARAFFDRPNWENFNKYTKGCIDVDPDTGATFLDTLTLREKKFRNLLKKLIDGDGVEVPLDNVFFSSVMPEFAIALVDAYDNKISKEKLDTLMNDKFVKKVNEKIIEEEKNEDEKLKESENK